MSDTPSPLPSRHPALATRLCELTGVRYPIVQTGMGWVSGVRLTAASANAGALGILASATMSVADLREAIAGVRARTDAPFGVNLLAAQPDSKERVELMVREGVRVASFAQAPTRDLVRRLKESGLAVVCSIGAVRHAEKVAEWGVDAVICQGGEGGGHTGSVPTTLLLPQVTAAVDIPVIAAGGFFDGRGLAAALAYGADGVAMGTRFLLTRESRVPDAVKDAYLGTGVNGTVVTTAVDGYPQRVIRTALIDGLEKASALTRFPKAAANALRFRRQTGTSMRALLWSGLQMRREQELTWAQTALAANAPMLTKAAMVDGNLDVGIMPTGQVVGVIDELPTVAELVERIVAEADATLRRLCP